MSSKSVEFGREWAPAARPGVLRRAVLVLDVLAAMDRPESVREIAARAGLSKSAAQRLLMDLVSVELASQDPGSRRYTLGPRALALGVAYQRRLDARTAAMPHMERLCADLAETVGLSVGLAETLLHVDQVESQQTLHARFDVGRPLPLWSGAPARVLLACRSEAEIERIVRDREAAELAPANPPSPEDLVRTVHAVRRAGHARAFEETLPGVNTLSVPVLGAAGDLAAVLSVTAPTARLSADRMDDVLPQVIRSALLVSVALGWRGGGLPIPAPGERGREDA